MKAKFINENISDVLKPKSEEELGKILDPILQEHYNISYKEYKKLADELVKLGIKILEFYSLKIDEMTIKAYKVYHSNWQIAKCLTKKEATLLIESHKKYVYEKYDNTDIYKIEDDYEYLTVWNIKKLIKDLKTKK